MEIAALVAGVLLGALIGWLWAAARGRAAEGSVAELRTQAARAEEGQAALQRDLDETNAARVQAETRLAEAARSLDEQKTLVEESRRALGDTFKALSDDALKSNNEAFLTLARKSMEGVLAEARGDLSKRQEAIGGLVKPLQESLKRYDEQIRSLEATRQKAYGSLEEQLRGLATASRQLERETSNLVTALRAPQVRGRWGEMTLRRVVEMAGMSEHCDYAEQAHTTTDDGVQRPDLIVRLPAGRRIVVDAKIPLDAYLDATSAEGEEARVRCLQRHAKHMRDHMMRLAQKAYCDQVDGAVDFTVMFVPGESFLGAAVEQDPRLIEEGMERRVVLATPTTLIALLRAVAYGWRQEQLAENARKISVLGRDLYDRMRTLAGHVGDVGKGLLRATQAYNRAVGSIERRILPAARRFKELGVTGGAEIPEVEKIETTPRVLDEATLDEEDAE
jgi:DNA recombination protein RmuC